MGFSGRSPFFHAVLGYSRAIIASGLPLDRQQQALAGTRLFGQEAIKQLKAKKDRLE